MSNVIYSATLVDGGLCIKLYLLTKMFFSKLFALTVTLNLTAREAMCTTSKLELELQHHPSQIDEMSALTINLITSNWMYGGSFTRLFPFCNANDTFFTQLMRQMIQIEDHTIMIGEKGYEFPLRRTIHKSSFNVIILDSSSTLIVSIPAIILTSF
jgi:hypothetical protein